MKALLRSARALSALDKLAEAMDAFERLRMLEREVGEEEADVGRRWRDETVKKVERRQRREREDRERERRRMEERAAMVIALTVRFSALRDRDTSWTGFVFLGCSNGGSSFRDRPRSSRCSRRARPT